MGSEHCGTVGDRDRRGPRHRPRGRPALRPGRRLGDDGGRRRGRARPRGRGADRARVTTAVRIAFAGDLREKLAMTNLVSATFDAHDAIDVLVNGSRLFAASDPLSPEGDQLEATLAQNVVATLRLSQIVARRMIELADAGARARGSCDRQRQLGAGGAVHPDADGLFGRLRRGRAADAHPGAGAGAASHSGERARGRRRARPLARRRAAGNRGPRPRRSPRSRRSAESAIRRISPAALFLASPSAGFVTGQVLSVDGGRSLVDPLSVWRG